MGAAGPPLLERHSKSHSWSLGPTPPVMQQGPPGSTSPASPSHTPPLGCLLPPHQGPTLHLWPPAHRSWGPPNEGGDTWLRAQS